MLSRWEILKNDTRQNKRRTGWMVLWDAARAMAPASTSDSGLSWAAWVAAAVPVAAALARAASVRDADLEERTTGRPAAPPCPCTWGALLLLLDTVADCWGEAAFALEVMRANLREEKMGEGAGEEEEEEEELKEISIFLIRNVLLGNAREKSWGVQQKGAIKACVLVYAKRRDLY